MKWGGATSGVRSTDNELVYLEMFLGQSKTKLGNFSDSHGHRRCEIKELSLRRVAWVLKCLCQKNNSFLYHCSIAISGNYVIP
jgi:hypothetical protein